MIFLEDELVSNDPETGAQWSNREIARRCAVDETLVRRLRPASAAEPQIDGPPAVARGGIVYPMKLRDSAKPTEPAPSAPVEVASVEAPAAEAEPALPLDAPPSNVIRAGDRFSLVPAPGSVELKAPSAESS